MDFKTMDAWKLGKNYLEPMFVDYSQDETDAYVERLKTTLVATQYKVLWKGFVTDVCKDDYLSHYYNQVWESENWTKAEVSDITYVHGYVPFSKVSSDHTSEKLHKPEVTLAVDHQGLITPMATGVMLVKEIAGKVCSCVLRVIYDSGGSKSMCHKRVIPAGVRIRTDRKQLFCTLAGAYASKGNI